MGNIRPTPPVLGKQSLSMHLSRNAFRPLRSIASMRPASDMRSTLSLALPLCYQCRNREDKHGGDSGISNSAASGFGFFRKSCSIVGGLTALTAGVWYAQRRAVGASTYSNKAPSLPSCSVAGEDVASDDPLGRETRDEEASATAKQPEPKAKPVPEVAESNGGKPFLVLRSAAAAIPHPDKVAKGGEDAHFIAENSCVIGVADGVGGWADIGVDAGEYARLLMNSAKLAAKRFKPSPTAPQKILEAAYAITTVRGSSTACIVVLDGEQLHASNLGDSGFLVVRDGDVIFQSPQQQHDFNFPFQLGSPGTISDSPSAAQSFTIKVKSGDVIIMGTDGLFDNVFSDEAAAIVTVASDKGEEPQVAASALVSFAQMRARDRQHMSPFAVSAQSLGYYYLGGKMDDITVLVSYVTSTGTAPPADETNNSSQPKSNATSAEPPITPTMPVSKL